MNSLQLSYQNQCIVLNVYMGVGIGGDRWPAANVFCEYISSEDHMKFYSSFLESKTVIELGSGTGLVGILISKLFSPLNVVVTDQESHMELIASNLLLNNASLCKAETLDWKSIKEQGSRKYDVIVAMEWYVFFVNNYLFP